MQNPAYRKALVVAVNTISDTRQDLFGKTLNLAMNGPLKEIGNAFEEGDRFQFDIEHFKNTNDANLDELVSLMEKLEESFERLVNLNGLEEE